MQKDGSVLVTNQLAIAAIASGRGGDINNDLARARIHYQTAFNGFDSCRNEFGDTCVVRSGLWGAGAFGNSRHLMMALQILASKEAGVELELCQAFDRRDIKFFKAKILPEVNKALEVECAIDDKIKHVYSICRNIAKDEISVSRRAMTYGKESDFYLPDVVAVVGGGGAAELSESERLARIAEINSQIAEIDDNISEIRVALAAKQKWPSDITTDFLEILGAESFEIVPDVKDREKLVAKIYASDGGNIADANQEEMWANGISSFSDEKGEFYVMGQDRFEAFKKQTGFGASLDQLRSSLDQLRLLDFAKAKDAALVDDKRRPGQQVVKFEFADKKGAEDFIVKGQSNGKRWSIGLLVQQPDNCIYVGPDRFEQIMRQEDDFSSRPVDIKLLSKEGEVRTPGGTPRPQSSGVGSLVAADIGDQGR